MSDEIKYMGSTKKEIWDAYKEAKTQLADLQDKPVSTSSIAKEENIKHSVALSNSLDLGTMSVTLTALTTNIADLKSQYDALKTAIDSKKAELKEVHNIEITANDLAALAIAKDKMIERADAKARIIEEEADRYKTNLMIQANDTYKKIQMEREREEEQYIYETERKRKMESDEINDMLDARKRSLDMKIKEVLDKEKMLNERETYTKKLEADIVALNENMVTKVEQARVEAEERAKKSAQVQANIVKSSTDAEVRIYQSKIESLESKIADLVVQVEQAKQYVSNANIQVSDMARSALQAKADAATVAEVSKIAAGAGNKK